MVHEKWPLQLQPYPDTYYFYVDAIGVNSLATLSLKFEYVRIETSLIIAGVDLRSRAARV